MIRTDIFRRGVPWMLLIKRSKMVETDLNVSKGAAGLRRRDGDRPARVARHGRSGPWFPPLLGLPAALPGGDRRPESRLLPLPDPPPGGGMFALGSAPLHLIYYCLLRGLGRDRRGDLDRLGDRRRDEANAAPASLGAAARRAPKLPPPRPAHPSKNRRRMEHVPDEPSSRRPSPSSAPTTAEARSHEALALIAGRPPGAGHARGPDQGEPGQPRPATPLDPRPDPRRHARRGVRRRGPATWSSPKGPATPRPGSTASATAKQAASAGRSTFFDINKRRAPPGTGSSWPASTARRSRPGSRGPMASSPCRVSLALMKTHVTSMVTFGLKNMLSSIHPSTTGS